MSHSWWKDPRALRSWDVGLIGAPKSLHLLLVDSRNVRDGAPSISVGWCPQERVPLYGRHESVTATLTGGPRVMEQLRWS